MWSFAPILWHNSHGVLAAIRLLFTSQLESCKTCTIIKCLAAHLKPELRNGAQDRVFEHPWLLWRTLERIVAR